MRLLLPTIALVATVQLCCVSVCKADGETPLLHAAMKKAAEEVVATPIQELWKDLYAALVREKGSKALRSARYSVRDLRFIPLN